MMTRIEFRHYMKEAMVWNKNIFCFYIIAISSTHSHNIPGIYNPAILCFHVHTENLWMTIVHFRLSVFHYQCQYKYPLRLMYITNQGVSTINYVSIFSPDSHHGRMNSARNKCIWIV